MEKRLELHEKLLTLCKNVYYQPPSSEKMVYPCIRYSPTVPDVKYADNRVYASRHAYLVTYISRLPADGISDRFFDTFSYIHPDRYYTADNLHHYTFVLYY